MELQFAIKHDFKAILRQFSANGSMPESFLGFLEVASVQELRDAQPANHLIKQPGSASDQVCLTLAAISILNNYYAKNKKLWNLVEKKARKYVSS